MAQAVATDAFDTLKTTSVHLFVQQEKRKLSELVLPCIAKRSRTETYSAITPFQVAGGGAAALSSTSADCQSAEGDESHEQDQRERLESREQLKNYERLVFNRKLMNLDSSRFKALGKYILNKLSQWKSRDELRFRALHLPKEIRQKPPRRFLKLASHELSLVDTVLSDTVSENRVAKIDGVPLTNKLMACLGPNEWLNDEIINAYMSLLNARSRSLTAKPLTSEQILAKSRPLKCYFWNTFFYPTLTGETHSGRRDGYDYSRVKKWTTRKNLDIFDYDMIFFPLHIHKVHWALGCLDMKSNLVFYFDSLGNDDGHEFFTHIIQYLQDEHQDKKKAPLPSARKWLWAGNNFSCSVLTSESIMDPSSTSSSMSNRTMQNSTTFCSKIPLQSNGSDCGVFTCQYAECLSISQFPFDFNSDDIVFRRKLMVYQLINGAVI